jgi:AcrR family transcriptional regulator
VSRTRPQVTLAAAIARTTDVDERDGPVLDAAERLLHRSGLRGWSVDDVAKAANVGRMTVYRRFPSRDDLIHSVLARELRRTLDAIAHAAGAKTDLEDRAVAAVGAAMDALDGSVVDSLLRSDPSTFLPYLTTDAGPLVALARDAIAAQVSAATGRPAPLELAEACARMGLSFILTRESVVPLANPKARVAAVRRVVQPLLVAFGAVSSRSRQ